VNAVRHTIWQASIASKYGAGIAKQAGNAHESNPNVDLSVRSFSGKDALSKADQSIDLLNNQIGRSIGAANPGASPQALAGAVLDYYHDNGLYTAKQTTDGTVSIVQTKLSDAEYKQAQDQLQKMDANGYKH
jgi:hypothetical protein